LLFGENIDRGRKPAERKLLRFATDADDPRTRVGLVQGVISQQSKGTSRDCGFFNNGTYIPSVGRREAVLVVPFLLSVPVQKVRRGEGRRRRGKAGGGTTFL